MEEKMVEYIKFLLHYKRELYNVYNSFVRFNKAVNKKDAKGKILIHTRKGFYDFSHLKILNKKYCNSYRMFTILPSITGPKWIIPVNSLGLIKSSLAMYQPSRRSIQFLKNVFSIFPYSSLSLFMDNVIIIFEPLHSNDFEMQKVTSFLSTKYDINTIEMALFCGTPGLTAKKTLQIMHRKSGKILSYLKIGETPHTVNLLENESKILEKLKELKIKSAKIPAKLLAQKDESTYFLLIDTERSHGFYSLDTIRGSHVKFLAEICKKTLKQMPIVKWINENIRISEKIKDEFISISLKRVVNTFKKRDMLYCMIHGDFTPWNTFFTSEGTLFVFDWELAKLEGFPFYDLLNFMIKKWILVKHFDAAKITKLLYTKKFQDTLREYVKAIEEPIFNDFEIYILLYLLRELSIFSNAVFTDEIEERKRLSMVNALKGIIQILLEKE